MKKILVALFSILILLGTATTTLADKSVKVQVVIDKKSMSLETVNLKLDGKNVSSDVPAVNYEGRSLVPIRVISEGLGAKVDWDGKTETATISTSDKVIKIKINSSKATINGKQQDLPDKVPAKLMSTSKSASSRTMVPLRFVMEALDANIEWDENTNTAIVQSNNKVNTVNELKGIEKQIINGKEAIVIKNASTPKINKFQLLNPDRIVVDIRNTNLNNVGSYIKTDVVKEVRVSQYTGKEYDSKEQVSRVVLDLSEDYENPKFRTEERGNDIIVYVEGTKKAPVVTPPVVQPPVVIPPEPPVSQPNDNTQKIIVVDAGHGGSDSGATGNGLVEKKLTLEVALKTQLKLEELGYKVIMTRTADVYPSLADRYKLANANKADAFISIHFNSATATSATGIETLYSTKNDQNKEFAKAVQDEVIKSTGAKRRPNELVERNGLAVLKGTTGLSSLVELGFISNLKDAQEIKTDSYLEKCATGIANGIHKFLSK